jgi:dihydrofolate reductase
LAHKNHEEEVVRELILKMSVSIDGFVAGPNGETQWMFGGDPEAKDWSVETIWNASLHIMGSRTFRDMASYWPTATGMFAPPMNEIPKAVFSRQGQAILSSANLPAAPDVANTGAGQSTTLQPGAGSWAQAHVASGDLATEIAALKAGDGKPIIAHGGASFARSLVAAGLVDAFVLLMHPVVLGRGMPVFSEIAAPMSLKLASSRAFPGGAVAQVYRAA